MSGFPAPRNIRRTWRAVPVQIEQARVHLADRSFSGWAAKGIVEVRAWGIARGRGRGLVARIDYLFDDGEQASLRFLSRSWQLRLGVECCR